VPANDMKLHKDSRVTAPLALNFEIR